MEVSVSSRFKKSFGRLSSRVQEKAIEKIGIFKNSEGGDPRLKVHKLHGKKKEEWAYSIDYSYRISFLFLEPKKVLYTDIGTHNEIY